MTAERSDEALLRGLAARDVTALEALYNRYGSPAYSLALRVTASPEIAADLVQGAFLSVWQAADSFSSDRDSVRSFVLGAVHQRAVAQLRARASGAPRGSLNGELSPAGDDDFVGDIEHNRERSAVKAAVQALPPEQRESILLAYFGGLSYAEIAERLSVPLGTVKTRMRLGVDQLRALMAQPAAH